MNNDPNTYLLRYSPHHNDAPIQSIVFAGTPATTEKSSVLHWRIFLVIGATASVKVDLTPGQDARTGLLVITSLAYSTSNTNAAAFTFIPRVAVTVRQMIDYLIGKG